ncbi:MAG: C45 family peptidase [Bacteroidota bacterium]
MIKKLLYSIVFIIIAFIIAFLIYFKLAITINPPTPNDLSPLELKRLKIADDHYTCGSSWLRRSNTGLWELYVEGSAFERGVIIGKLTKELLKKQEGAFVGQINKMISSKIYLYFLKYFVAWFNRNIDSYIDEEYKLEIYGVSFSASDEYSFVGPKYQRILNYHAAHDIGHALQDLNMVGCTSFSGWDQKTDDSSLIVGRNFDFYVGDEFAEDKIIYFYNPEKGYKFMMVSWAGMIGAVSGMNEKGLTVTLNAARSEIPESAATPISIVAREILQFAKNIDEAASIAAKRKTFVSESIMIGSFKDNKTVIIEKSPHKTGLFSPKNNFIICTNHFQGDAFSNDKRNIENIKESSSLCRHARVFELINKYQKINVKNTAEILRDQNGLNDKNIGMGNEKAINQLIAHHSIIFKPSKQLVWISTNPFQLGEYVAYDLKRIFNDPGLLEKKEEIYEKGLVIPADTFLVSDDYRKFLQFKKIKKRIRDCIGSDEIIILNEEIINEFVSTNPEYYLVYSILGDYYKKINKFAKAKKYYDIALTKEIPAANELIHIKKELNTIN